MSRRSRRRGNTGGAGWLGKAALALILLGLVVAGVAYAMIRSYLHSDAFRRFMAEEVGAAAKVRGEFEPFRWEGLAVDSDGFHATGDGLVRELRVEGLHTEIGVGGLGRGVWEIQGSRAQRLEISLDARKSGVGLPAPKPRHDPKPPKKKPNGWLPTEIELQGIDVENVIVRASLKQGPASVTGLRIHVEPTTGHQAYQAELADGAIVLPYDFLPTIHLERASLRYQDRRVFLSSADASAWSGGRLVASGEWDSAAGTYALQGDASGVKCDELFNEDWAKRFTGDVVSDFTLTNFSGESVARGQLAILKGTLTALPVLDALAAYADTRRFRILALSEAHTDWRWRSGEILLTNLVLASEGLVRLEGAIAIRGERLDGTFRLGLAPGTLASIPGAETDVFLPGERGLVWAPLRITGTLDDPKEDLSDRLVAAAGARMFDVIPETGEKVIKYSRSLLGDKPDKAIDKGLKIIEQGTGIIDEAGGLIDGFFGGGSREEPERPKEDP
jgi:hypothetical protein